MRYFFILGRNPTLSFAEIIAFLTQHKIPYTVEVVSKEVCLIAIEEKLEEKQILGELGGVVKFGVILSEIPLAGDVSAFEKAISLPFLLPHLQASRQGKIHLGISMYTGGATEKDIARFSSRLKYLNKTIKANVQETGRNVGFVQIKGRFLSSVSVAKNELLAAGIEIVFILGKDTLIMGKTRAVQEFGSFSFRDMGRPAKDKRSGILPPKLARMMINLASRGPDSVLLDPFCGSGTIVQEALLLGFLHVLGSDMSEKAVLATQRNIDWLKNSFRGFTIKAPHIQIFQSDIHVLSRKIASSSIDIIVTEPYLGPPLFQKPDKNMAEKILRNITPLYQDTFSQYTKILKKGGRVVTVFPCFEVNGKMHYLEIEEKIKACGFQVIPLLPPNSNHSVFTDYTIRGSIIYGGKEQFVKREIRCFEL